jgi:WD40 repeat protein
MLRSLSILKNNKTQTILALLLVSGLSLLSCGDASTSVKPEEQGHSSVSIALKVAQTTAADIARAEIVVTAADIGEIRQELTISGNTISGTIAGIPAGSQRTFVFNGYDINGNLIFRGSTEVDMAAGEVVPVNIAVRRIGSSNTPSKIAFHSDRDGNREIYVMDADGSNQTRLTNAAGDDAWASWSPDGTKIVFQSNRDGNFEIYMMNSNGSNKLNLTNHPADDQFPSWSPDGSKIAFSSNQDGKCRDIHNGC